MTSVRETLSYDGNIRLRFYPTYEIMKPWILRTFDAIFYEMHVIVLTSNNAQQRRFPVLSGDSGPGPPLRR
jgi:hypothetical protein